MSITKPEMIEAVQAEVHKNRRSEISKADVARMMDALQTVVMRELRAGRDVKLLGLGKLKVRRREARQGRNPLSGETIDIPAKNTLGFKAASNIDL